MKGSISFSHFPMEKTLKFLYTIVGSDARLFCIEICILVCYSMVLCAIVGSTEDGIQIKG